MWENLLQIAIFIGGGLFGLVGWVMKRVFTQIDAAHTAIRELDKKVDDHKLHVSESYTTKRDIKDMQESLIMHLRRIEDKLDRKVDK